MLDRLRDSFQRLLATYGLRYADEAEEARFKEFYVHAHVAKTRAFMLMGGALVYIFFNWDRIIDPVGWTYGHAMRGFVVAPAAVLAAILMSTRRWRPHEETINALTMLLAYVGLTLIYMHLAEGFRHGGVGIVLVMMFEALLLRMRFAWFAASALAGAAFFLGAHALYFGHIDILLMNTLVVASSLLFGLFATWSREMENRRLFDLMHQLEAAKLRVEDLVYSMLPKEIVSRIQSGETTIADSHAEVSIVFADLQGFTTLMRKLSARQVVEILNTLFTRFDAMAEQHGIEKIKTIGDAYMAVGGMRQDDSHAEQAAYLTLAMRDAVVELSRELGIPIHLRIGLHVGPVIAGVIGLSKPVFDCWGDSVNIASRLESTAPVGTIQISEPAYWRLQNRFEVRALQHVDLKGIGPTPTYLLLGVLDGSGGSVSRSHDDDLPEAAASA